MLLDFDEFDLALPIGKKTKCEKRYFKKVCLAKRGSSQDHVQEHQAQHEFLEMKISEFGGTNAKLICSRFA